MGFKRNRSVGLSRMDKIADKVFKKIFGIDSYEFAVKRAKRKQDRLSKKTPKTPHKQN